jgi:hypothetical protein
MTYETVDAALGAIVFGPNCDTLEGMQWTAGKLRQAAALLEYRYAIERRSGGAVDGVALYETGPVLVRDQTAPPAKRKRKHRATRPAGNGAAAHAPGVPGGEPLFPPEGATE